MQLGLVGLGKMGFNMRERLREGGHEVIGYDPRPEVTDVASLAGLAEALAAPRVVWVMVPSGPITDETIMSLAGELSAGDLVIDGGNSRFTEDGTHAKVLGDKGIAFIDAGVSGGIWGLKEGYGLMVGGSDEDVARAMPIFETLRPPGDLADGFVHAGPVGAGHYAKMVHNGIEYGLMTAYAEGYELLAAEPLITDVQAVYPGVEQRHRGAVVAAATAGEGAQGRPRIRRNIRLHRGFRRRTVDGRGSDQPSGAHPGDRGGAVRAVRLPPGRFADDEVRVGTAQPVRRPRGQTVPLSG